MSPTTTNEKVAAAMAVAQVRARELAARAKPAAAQVKPLARSTQEAALRQMHATRAWAAPRVERSGQVLQDSVAPKVADMLSSAARRIEPEQPRSRNWWTLSGLLVLIAGAAAAAAIALRKRSTANSADPADEADTGDAAPGASEAAPGTEQSADSSNTDATRASRTS
jgi:hypothetical protein